jgi:hypothetical protein
MNIWFCELSRVTVPFSARRHLCTPAHRPEPLPTVDGDDRLELKYDGFRALLSIGVEFDLQLAAECATRARANGDATTRAVVAALPFFFLPISAPTNRSSDSSDDFSTAASGEVVRF